MKISFVTTNTHKFTQADSILRPYGIELKQVEDTYPEDHDATIEEIARSGAQLWADKRAEPVITEDTGIFFAAYDSFPGALPKFVFQQLGFEGILKLLEGKNRSAYFKTVVAYAVPGQEVKHFIGKMSGKITDKVYNPGKDRMAYEHIFIPQGLEVTVSDLSLEEKNSISQRGQAFRALGEYLQKGK